MGTGIGDTGSGIIISGARNGSSRLVHERQSGADQRLSAPGDDELSTDALSKSSLDASVFSICTEISDCCELGNGMVDLGNWNLR